ncbi:MAG: hypothetical protein ACFFDH_09500 [Promethearchaeota archaeon]
MFIWILLICCGILGLTSMLWLVLGDYRAGKTIRLVVEAFSEEYDNRKILTNFKLKHPNAQQIFNPLSLANLNNVLVLLDEMQNWFNSHNTFSLTNEFFTDFIHDCDKSNVDVFATSHRFMSNDIDFRIGCHRLIKCERIGFRDPRINRLDDTRDFRFTVFSMSTGKILYKDRLRYEIAKNYFDLYDTTERVKRLENETMELTLLLKYNPKLGNKKLKQVAKKVRPIFEAGKRLTYGTLANELGDLGYSFTDSILRRIYSLLLD